MDVLRKFFTELNTLANGKELSDDNIRTVHQKYEGELNTQVFSSKEALVEVLNHHCVVNAQTNEAEILMRVLKLRHANAEQKTTTPVFAGEEGETLNAFTPIKNADDLMYVLEEMKDPETKTKRITAVMSQYMDDEVLLYQLVESPAKYQKLRGLLDYPQMNKIAEKLYNRWETIYLACRVAQNTPRYKKSNAAIWIARENPQIQERLGVVINRAADPKKPNGRTAKAWQLMDMKGDSLAKHVYAYGYNRSSYATGSVAVQVSKGYVYDGRVTDPETQVNMNNTSAHPRLHDATAMLKTLDDESSRPTAKTSNIQILNAPWPERKQNEKKSLTM